MAQLDLPSLMAFLGLRREANETLGFMGAPAHQRSLPSFTSAPLYDGFLLTGASTLLLIVAEVASLREVRGVFRQAGGASLYLTALCYNIINFFFIGPATYAFAVTFLCSSAPTTAVDRILASLGLVLVHSIGYYLGHVAMHTKALYWAHRFHHRFNSHVVPMSANAVSFVEYCFAYMLPFIVGCLLLKPDALALFAAASLISINNILIHTPSLEKISRLLVPWWAVSTSDHLEHHRRLTTSYAAPTLSIDRIVSALMGQSSTKAVKSS